MLHFIISAKHGIWSFTELLEMGAHLMLIRKWMEILTCLVLDMVQTYENLEMYLSCHGDIIKNVGDIYTPTLAKKVADVAFTKRSETFVYFYMYMSFNVFTVVFGSYFIYTVIVECFVPVIWFKK